MIFAIPARDGMVDSHFGHCAYYTVIEANDQNEIVKTYTLDTPEGCGCKSNIAYQMREMGTTVICSEEVH